MWIVTINVNSSLLRLNTSNKFISQGKASCLLKRLLFNSLDCASSKCVVKNLTALFKKEICTFTK